MSNSKPVPESSVAKRDFDRQIYRETHISKRARRFITVQAAQVSGNQKGSERK